MLSNRTRKLRDPHGSSTEDLTREIMMVLKGTETNVNIGRGRILERNLIASPKCITEVLNVESDRVVI